MSKTYWMAFFRSSYFISLMALIYLWVVIIASFFYGANIFWMMVAIPLVLSVIGVIFFYFIRGAHLEAMVKDIEKRMKDGEKG